MSLVDLFLVLHDTDMAVDRYRELLPGPGYQLFFAQPGDASVNYCESHPFSISAGVAVVVTNTVAAQPLQTTLQATAVITAVAATAYSTSGATGLAGASGHTTTVSTSAARATIVFAPNGALGSTPGGPTEQNTNSASSLASSIHAGIGLSLVAICFSLLF